jgi:hypothetical protein
MLTSKRAITGKSLFFHLLATSVSLEEGHFARRYEECDNEVGG